MSDDAEDVFRKFGYGDPRWMATPDDLRDPALHPSAVNQFKLPPAPRPEIRNDNSRPDAYVDAGVRDWATPGSVLAGAYGLGRTIGTGYEDLRMGDYANAAKALPEIAMAMAPMPGPKGTRGTRSPRLDMSQEAKAARMAEMGMHPEQYYHATTHKFREVADPLDPNSPYEKESYHGPAFYMTTDRADASRNYQGLGPDLTNRIANTAETKSWELQNIDPKERARLQRYARRIDDIPDYWNRTPENKLAYAAAHRDLVGKYGSEGHLMPVVTNMRNPVHVGGPKDTFFAYEWPDFRVEKRGDEYHVLDPEGRLERSFNNENDAYNYASDLRYEGAPSGSGAKIMEYLNRHSPEIAARVQDDMFDGIYASRLERVIRDAPEIYDLYLGDQTAGPGAFLQNLYRELGHDAAVLHNADKQFPGMGMAPGTSHVALFDPRRVRHIDAKFDPAKMDSRDLMAGLTGATVLPITTAEILAQMYGDKPEKP